MIKLYVKILHLSFNGTFFNFKDVIKWKKEKKKSVKRGKSIAKKRLIYYSLYFIYLISRKIVNSYLYSKKYYKHSITQNTSFKIWKSNFDKVKLIYFKWILD